MAIIKDIMIFRRRRESAPTGNLIPTGNAHTGIASPAQRQKPLAAPAAVAQERLKICMACENRKNTQCRLFACCHKTISDTVNMALEKCPLGHWGMWIPPKQTTS